MVHDPQTAVVKSAFWHLKKVSGVVAPYRFWYFRCENQGFGISQNYFFLHNICSTLALFSSMVSADLFGGFAQPCKEDTWLTRSQELGPRSFRHMNCWTNFFSSGCSFTWLWQPRRLGKLLGMNFFKDSQETVSNLRAGYFGNVLASTFANLFRPFFVLMTHFTMGYFQGFGMRFPAAISIRKDLRFAMSPLRNVV